MLRILWLCWVLASPALGSGLGREILDFEPSRRPGVAQADFDKGSFFLEETRRAVENDPARFNVADYWNVTVAFVLFDEPTERIERVFQAAIDADSRSLCAYVEQLGAASIERAIPETFAALRPRCANVSSETAPFDADAYAAEHSLDPELVRAIDAIRRDDARYRLDDPVDWERQRPLDLRNQERILELSERHDGYIGEELVGPKLSHVMWAVVQHSNEKMMRRFLPEIHAEVRRGKLDSNPLKLLIDRLHRLEHGTQIFGSQAGIDLADETTRRAVREEYGFGR